MPAIIVNDYTWRQTPEAIIISTRLIGHPKKVDLFAIDNYMKASYPPFILELFLWARILEEESECTIGEETAVFTLKKEEMGLEWQSLVMEGLDKDKKRACRSRALELARVRAEERAKARSEKRQALQKQAVRAQIDLDTTTLNRIEAMRDSHRKEAMRELEEWRSRAEQPILHDIDGEIQENRKAYRAPLKWFADEGQATISQETATDLEVSNSEAGAAEHTEEKKHGSIKNTVQGNSSDGLGGDETDKIQVLRTEIQRKEDEQNKLLSAGRNCDSTRAMDNAEDKKNSVQVNSFDGLGGDETGKIQVLRTEIQRKEDEQNKLLSAGRNCDSTRAMENAEDKKNTVQGNSSDGLGGDETGKIQVLRTEIQRKEDEQNKLLSAGKHCDSTRAAENTEDKKNESIKNTVRVNSSDGKNCDLPGATENTEDKTNESIKNTVRVNSSDGLGGDETGKIQVLPTEIKQKEDEQNKLLSAGKNGDSTRVVNTDSSSSDSSDSDGSSEESPFAGTNKSTVKEMDERALRKYYRRKEKENANRGKELVRRLLNGKTGCVTRGGGRIFDEPTVPTPRPRRCATIDVKFSERQFPTPARESQRLEEQEWLGKQAEARRKSGFVSEDLRAEEQDPQWLKDKGDEFFKAGNYLGAISAYTHGLKLSDKMSSLYVNRSAAHYASENYRRCAEDCSRALELMVPKCEGNRDSRARCHARLGAALCKLSAPQHGIPELEAALKLAPENETIKRDLQVAKRYFEIRD